MILLVLDVRECPAACMGPAAYPVLGTLDGWNGFALDGTDNLRLWPRSLHDPCRAMFKGEPSVELKGLLGVLEYEVGVVTSPPGDWRP